MTPSPEFLAQYAALTTGVGISELAGRTVICVAGSDSANILQSFSTNDIKKLAVGSGCEAFITTAQGKTLSHVLVFRDPDQIVLDTTPGQAAAIISHFDRYIITEDVQFTDRTAEQCDLLVAGPKAVELIGRATGSEPPTNSLGHAQSLLAGRAVTIRRVEFAGPDSFFIQVAAVDSADVLAALCVAGATHCDTAAVDSARLEAGVPLFGLDITPDNLPQEVGRDAKAISFTKGCYLGQETVARIDAIGHVNRLLVGLRFSGNSLPASGMALLVGEQPAGHVTSAAWSPRLAGVLALGYVRRNYVKSDTIFTSSAGNAEIVELPLAPA
jgi:folate-binding protein YgfZ